MDKGLELMYFATNAILFQRNMYQRNAFARVRKWEMPVFIIEVPEVTQYLRTVFASMRSSWLGSSGSEATLRQYALVIMSEENMKAVERWNFTLKYTSTGPPRAEEDVRQDLRKLLRQIGVSVTFLPTLQGIHTFRIVIEDETSETARTTVPEKWVAAPRRDVEHAIDGQFHTLDLGSLSIELEVLYQYASYV